MVTKQIFSVSRASTILPLLVRHAAAGEEILIGILGQPLARLIAAGISPRPRLVRLLKGTLHVPDSFDEPLPETVLDAFEGKA